MKAYCGGKIILPGEIRTGADILTENGKIVCVAPAGTAEADETVELNGAYIAPGFIDIHCHGGGGAEFIDATPEAFGTACAMHASHGTRVIFPTVSATDPGTVVKVLETAEKVKNSCDCVIGGIHLEGPYLSPAMTGGQAGEYVKKPLPEEYEELAGRFGSLIARWTYAPEEDEDCRFLDHIVSKGIVPSTGHSAAEYDCLASAFKKGNRLVTHLYSCTSTVTRKFGFRYLGIIETAFLLDDMDVEIIADGKHLPPELIRMIVKIKGIDRVCMITDSLRPAGIAGEGEVFADTAVPFVVEDGVAKLLDRSAFAGSIATCDMLLQTAVDAGFTLPQAVRMLSTTPARVMGLDDFGEIAPGKAALFTVFDEELNIIDIK